MNKRQRKKRIKEVNRRFDFINSHLIIGGRQNGKTYLKHGIYAIVLSRRYRPFKGFEKEYKKLRISVDMGNGRDYTAKCYYQFYDGVCKIIKTEIE